MEQRDELERERDLNRKLQQRLDKVASPPQQPRRKFSRPLIGLVLLMLVALLVFFAVKMSDVPAAGSQKVYPDQNGTLQKPGGVNQ